MARWARFVIRHRRKVVLIWVAISLLGIFATSGLGQLLTNRFSVPGSDAERGLDLAKQKLGERGDGAFTLVVRATGRERNGPKLVHAAEAAASRGAKALKSGKAGPAQRADRNVVYVQITTPLDNAEAANKTPAIRRAIGDPKGVETYLSGYPAINHDTEPIYNRDTQRGEMIAIPIALVVMAFMLGTLAGIAVPLAFALITIPTTLGFVWIFAHVLDMPVYVEQIVTLIGLAIAIDYSMLVVFRYREELEADADAHDALVRTTATAGRATLFSGMTVALGLGLLILMPVPFMKAMGVGGFLVPLVSICASATLLPALLAMVGRRINSLRIVPRRVLARRAKAEGGMWTRLARSIMRRPAVYLAGSAALILALALPATKLHLTGGDNRGIPTTTEATKGLALMQRALGPGALSPNQLIIDLGKRGAAWSERSIAAQRRLVKALRSDPQIQKGTIQAPGLLVKRPGEPNRRTLALAQKATLVDPHSELVQIRAASRTDAGTQATMDLVERIRDRYVPRARFDAKEIVLTGTPAFGVDFIDKSYSAFPWLVLGVLMLSYLLLLFAFRSLLLPLKAVLMNVLSVSATYGLLVLAFQDGWGEFLFQTSDQIEAWVPIFLFTMLFGLSMDYEVFLLSRMREEWDTTHDNEGAVAGGLEHTGRIITAAAIIMVAAFTGFMTGSFVGIQQFGFGLSAAILLDATVVRAILVPAAMKLLGEWNWYLPKGLRRLLRTRARGHAVAARSETVGGP